MTCRFAVPLLALLAVSAPLFAQRPAVPAADYARAEKFLAPNLAGPVMPIVRVDEKTRTLWYGANGREKGQDPYFLHFYRVGLDGRGTVSLTPDDGTHGDFFVRWLLDAEPPKEYPIK